MFQVGRLHPAANLPPVPAEPFVLQFGLFLLQLGGLRLKVGLLLLQLVLLCGERVAQVRQLCLLVRQVRAQGCGEVVLRGVLGAGCRGWIQGDGNEQGSVVARPEALGHQVEGFSFGGFLRCYADVFLAKVQREERHSEWNQDGQRNQHRDEAISRDKARPVGP